MASRVDWGYDPKQYRMSWAKSGKAIGLGCPAPADGVGLFIDARSAGPTLPMDFRLVKNCWESRLYKEKPNEVWVGTSYNKDLSWQTYFDQYGQKVNDTVYTGNVKDAPCVSLYKNFHPLFSGAYKVGWRYGPVYTNYDTVTYSNSNKKAWTSGLGGAWPQSSIPLTYKGALYSPVCGRFGWLNHALIPYGHPQCHLDGDNDLFKRRGNAYNYTAHSACGMLDKYYDGTYTKYQSDTNGADYCTIYGYQPPFQARVLNPDAKNRQGRYVDGWTTQWYTEDTEPDSRFKQSWTFADGNNRLTTTYNYISRCRFDDTWVVTYMCTMKFNDTWYPYSPGHGVEQHFTELFGADYVCARPYRCYLINTPPTPKAGVTAVGYCSVAISLKYPPARTPRTVPDFPKNSHTGLRYYNYLNPDRLGILNIKNNELMFNDTKLSDPHVNLSPATSDTTSLTKAASNCAYWTGALWGSARFSQEQLDILNAMEIPDQCYFDGDNAVGVDSNIQWDVTAEIRYCGFRLSPSLGLFDNWGWTAQGIGAALVKYDESSTTKAGSILWT